jgi:hypothetical protein
MTLPAAEANRLGLDAPQAAADRAPAADANPEPEPKTAPEPEPEPRTEPKAPRTTGGRR